MTDQGKKLPINPATGRAASTTNPNTWTPLDQALDALGKGKGQGVGFVFSPNDPFVGIDLDKCIQNNQLLPEARELVTKFDSYTDISPSGTGLHIFVKGTIPTGRRKGNIEMYATGRYFTLTTNHLKIAPDAIEERQSQLNDLYALLSPVKAQETQNTATREAFKPKEHQIFISDEKALEKAENARNGERFKSLWAGNILGFTSHSEARFTLILLIGYWTNYDAIQMERLFRQSALYDERCEEMIKGMPRLQYDIQQAIEKRRKK